jgi:all-trans-retinol 13,14-reductase
LLKGEVAIPCFGIAVPTFIDPSLAPQGKHGVIIMTMAPIYLAGNSWSEEKERMTDKLIAKAEKLIPNLSEHIVVQDAGTLSAWETYTLNSLGAAWDGLSPPRCSSNGWSKKHPFLFFIWQGTGSCPGGGVSAVALSGLRAALMILREQVR